MLHESRIDIYDYLYNLFYDVVTKNVYSMNEPQELSQSDTQDGFIVIRVGDLNDESEFGRKAYGWARCYVEAYVPPISRGRLDYNKYKEFEDAINSVIELASESEPNENGYSVQEGSVLSTDTDETTNANNAFFLFIKSFVVMIDKLQQPIPKEDLYIGFGESTLDDKSSIENLTNVQYYQVESIKGEYTIDTPSTLYLWICASRDIDDVTSNGFTVPIESPIDIDGLLCYRSSHSIAEGEMIFTIK